MSARDGGPAFPRTGEGFGNPLYDAPGMTLRDYFAAQALSMLNYHNILAAAVTAQETEWAIQNAAVLSYRLADAMLAERAKEPQP